RRAIAGNCAVAGQRGGDRGLAYATFGACDEDAKHAMTFFPCRWSTVARVVRIHEGDAAGNSSTTLKPPSASILALPPCAAATAATRAKPSPWPGVVRERSLRAKRWNSRLA